MREQIEALIAEMKSELIDLSEYIYEHPELGYDEYKSSKAHIDFLKKYNFDVTEKYLEIDTAFRAEYDSGKEGPTIGYLAEYDALPNIGHGCGHNLLGTTSTGAGIILSKLMDEIGGRVIVFGTPAEETSGAKVIMADEGAFDDVDVAMLAHPNDEYNASGDSLAIEPVEFTFKGKSAHAASNPEEGINALDGVLQTFNSINMLREHINPTAKIHGIITDGGKAANVVPELAVAQFYVRATTKGYLEELSEKVKNCARGASLATGTELEIRNHELPYDDMITNQALSDRFMKNLEAFGIEDAKGSKESFGSIDMGNVSHVCPAIHPYFAITEGKSLIAHTKEFAEATLTDTAYDNMFKTIATLALTGVDVIEDQSFLEEIQAEFNQRYEKNK